MSDSAENKVEQKEWHIADHDPKNWQALNVIGVLKVAAVGRAMGVVEDELQKKSGLEQQDFLRQICRLEEAKLVQSFVSQETTAGTYARRYRILPNVMIKITY